MMLTGRWIPTLFCALVLGAQTLDSATARAQANDSGADDASDATERARMHFRNGVDLYRERNYRAALIEFKRAYKASPHYKLLYNLGQASLELQEDAPAIEFFSQYLSEGADELSAERKHEVEQDIVRLQARLAHVTITTNQPGAEVRVDDSLVGTSPLDEPVKVSVGRRHFTATKHGFITAERTIDVAAGDHLELSLELKDRGQDLAKLQRQLAAMPSARQSDGGLSAAGWSGIATGVIGAGAVTLSILTGLSQQNYDNERTHRTSSSELASARNDAKAKALAADICWGATIAAGALTTVLLIVDASGDHTESKGAPIKIDLGAGSLHMRGQF